MVFLTVDSLGFHAGWSIVKLILVLVVVLILAFYTTKFIAKYQSNSLMEKSNIRFIDSYRVGGNKLISIVYIAGKYYALGIGKDEIQLIDRLDEEGITFSEHQKILLSGDKKENTESENDSLDTKVSFKDVLARVKTKN